MVCLILAICIIQTFSAVNRFKKTVGPGTSKTMYGQSARAELDGPGERLKYVNQLLVNDKTKNKEEIVKLQNEKILLEAQIKEIKKKYNIQK